MRINTLKAASVDLAVPAHEAPGLPEGLVLEGPFDAFASPEFRDGRVMPQSRASMLVSRTLGPQPGERVLDLCAAPGAKTTHIAALMEGRGSVVAVERNPRRAKELRRTCAVMGADGVEVRVGDARSTPESGPFDRVLVDPPCSGLGTLQSRPDIRWRATGESIAELAAIQRAILAAGAAAVRPGGALVYSVCTISRAEANGVIDPFLAKHSEFSLDEQRLLTPHRDGTDGFYIARLVRA
jgi:16S rRNA (cytosine967-C5)-methyltransferase